MPLKSASVAVVKETVRAQLLKQEQAVKKESSKRRKAMAAHLSEANEDSTQEQKEEQEAIQAALEEAALSEEETAGKGQEAQSTRRELATRKEEEREAKEARKRADLCLRLAATALQKLSPLPPIPRGAAEASLLPAMPRIVAVSAYKKFLYPQRKSGDAPFLPARTAATAAAARGSVASRSQSGQSPRLTRAFTKRGGCLQQTAFSACCEKPRTLLRMRTDTHFTD